MGSKPHVGRGPYRTEHVVIAHEAARAPKLALMHNSFPSEDRLYQLIE
jgi:hypothetical protein